MLYGVIEVLSRIDGNIFFVVVRGYLVKRELGLFSVVKLVIVLNSVAKTSFVEIPDYFSVHMGAVFSTDFALTSSANAI